MFKRILSAVTAFLIVAGAVNVGTSAKYSEIPLTANALTVDGLEDFTDDIYEGFVYRKFADHVVILNFPNQKFEGELVIPNEIDGLPVTELADDAFAYCEQITGITIPNSVTSIGNGAFGNCWNLTSITIPDNVTEIGSLAFYHCSSITEIKIPDGVSKLSRYVFLECMGLTDVTIPESVTEIDEGAFNRCSSLTEIKIPDGVTYIGEGAFAECTSLESINIPESITSISYGTFVRCPRLTELPIHDGITEIGGNAFADCSGLTKITIPDSVTSIGEGAFAGCSNLSEITLSESVEAINAETFASNLWLTEITIPKSVKSLDSTAFFKCENLAEITVLNPACEFSDEEIQYDFSGIIRGYENSTAQAYAEKWGYTFEALALEDEEEEWNYGLFRYEIIDDHVVITDCKETASTVIIPAKIDGLPVTEIGENAFRGCDRLTNVTLPDTITSIGKAAFAACTALTEISLPNGITSIEDNTFEFCTNLKTVNIPDSVTSIGEFAFSRCESLASISLPDGITNIGCYAFNYCSRITSVTIPAKVETIEQYTFDACESLTEVTVLNPDCHFSSANCISNYSWTIGFSGTIYGYECSTAQTFAQTCGYTFIALDKAPEQSINYGDANCDGIVSIADATAILQHLGSKDKYALSAQGEKNADVDGKAGITASDAIAIQQYDAKLVSKLPVSFLG